MSFFDNHGRMARYLRLSVTDRCNFNCMYCRDRNSQKLIPPKDLLSYEEMTRLVDIVHNFGIGKVRITGGEPFTRSGLAPFLGELRRTFPDIALSITTNGSLLGPYLSFLKYINLSSINISIDSFDSASFATLTGSDCLQKVLANLDAALGLDLKIKINVVAIKGITDKQIDDYLHVVKSMPVDLRFIEFMPVGSTTSWNESLFLSANELLRLARNRGAILSLIGQSGSDQYSGPARMYEVAGCKGKIGFISSMSNHFCDRCNRLRLTSKGALRTCLFEDREYKLKGLLANPRVTNDQIARVIRAACKSKPIGADLLRKKKNTPVIDSVMASIGG